MTYLTEQVSLNEQYRNGLWFNTFMDATNGMSGFDKGKMNASLQTKVLDWFRSAGIVFDDDFGRNEFANEYTMTSWSGNVGSTGTKVTGNPDIKKDEREIYEKFVKVSSTDIATKFQDIEWEELKRILYLNEKGLVKLNDRVKDLIAKHASKIFKLILMKYLSGFSDTYTSFTNGSTTGDNETFSLQTKFLSKLPRDLTFEKLRKLPRMLMEMGKINESENNIQVFMALPDIIFDALIIQELQKTPSSYQWVLGTQTNQPVSYYKNGIEFELKNRVDAESIKFECNLSTGISIRRLGQLESYHIWEQNVANTIGGKKTFKCPLFFGNEAFKFSMPKPNPVSELETNPDTDRTIRSTVSAGESVAGKYNVHFEERRVKASQSGREFSTNEYRAFTRQCFVPLQMENACAFEIDASAILLASPEPIVASQAALETLINTEYKAMYESTFYDTNHMDENHAFLKPVI